MSQLTDTLITFHNDLNRARDLLTLVEEFRAFAGSTRPVELSDDGTVWPEATTLLELAPQVRTDLPLLAGSMLLYACGRFEFFVREVVTIIADEIIGNSKDYGSLPESLRKEIFDRTVAVAGSPSKWGFETGQAERLISILGANLSAMDSLSFQVESGILGITETNMNSRTVAEVFKRVSITGVWNEIGKQAPLKKLLSKSTDNECTNEATNRLDALMKERNSLAHPTGETSFPSLDQVQSSCEFLRTLSSVIVDVAQVPQRGP